MGRKRAKEVTEAGRDAKKGLWRKMARENEEARHFNLQLSSNTEVWRRGQSGGEGVGEIK